MHLFPAGLLLSDGATFLQAWHSCRVAIMPDTSVTNVIITPVVLVIGTWNVVRTQRDAVASGATAARTMDRHPAPAQAPSAAQGRVPFNWAYLRLARVAAMSFSQWTATAAKLWL
jgi:hypothetical protein